MADETDNLDSQHRGAQRPGGPNLIAKARRQDRKHARRIQRLKERGRHHEAERLTRLRASSFSLRLASVADASRKACPEPKTGLGQVGLVRLAERINLSRPSDEPVRVRALPKRGGGFRQVMAFGIEGKARQRAVIQLLRPLAALGEGQRAVIGGGRQATCQKVIEALGGEYRWAIVIDIRNCFSSYDAEAIPDLLPLPRAITEASILSKNLNLTAARPKAEEEPKGQSGPQGRNRATRSHRHQHNQHQHTHPYIFPYGCQDCRRGLPQGSAASPLVSEMLLAPALAGLPAGAQVLTHLDDILVLTRTRGEADLILLALRVALERHPAGRLALRRADIRRTCDGFEFLGYRFRRRKGEPLAQPTQRNITRFHAFLDTHCLATQITGEGADKARHCVTSWCAQFRLWPAAERWRTMYLDEVDKAERFGEAIDAGGMARSGRIDRFRTLVSPVIANRRTRRSRRRQSRATNY